ncbi:MAG: transcription factor S [Nitrososphaerales archaeon]
MRFCPKCGTRLKPKAEENKQPKLVCEKCSYSTPIVDTPKAEQIQTPRAEKESIKVLGDDVEHMEALPTTKVECPKCGHDTAVWWMLQTRSADEATTQFYRCVKCNHTWRHYA